MDETRVKIERTVNEMARCVREKSAALNDKVSLEDYRSYAVEAENGAIIWTQALQKALDEHEVVVIPASDEVYYIDSTVTIPSNRRIEAEGAVISLTEGCTVLMLRNEHTEDGTHQPIAADNRDSNISIIGGRWEDSARRRLGYGRTGRYSNKEPREFFGVSTLFYFCNMDNLMICDVQFAHTSGFSVQTGDLNNAVFENIKFISCYADGLHLNGNSENILVRNVSGHVGDDLVALNMYDWLNSSVNFGPMKNVFCENLDLDPTSGYHAFRIQPGCYKYDDGTVVDCSITDSVIREVKGILTFKMYFQTPAYQIGQKPEWGNTGSADNLYFENITVDLDAPLDKFDQYLNSDPVRGYFGAFEINSNIGRVIFDGIDITMYDKYPLSAMVVFGPKSIRKGQTEVFDPYISSTVGSVEFRNIKVNGKKTTDLSKLIHVTSFRDVNKDGSSTGNCKVRKIFFEM